VSLVLGIAMVAETLLLLWVAWSHFDLATDNNALSTFIFLMLLYFAAFSVVSARERSWFWATMPSKTLRFALSADVLIGTSLMFVSFLGFKPLAWWQLLAVFVYAQDGPFCAGGVVLEKRRNALEKARPLRIVEHPG
jgi:H+-transporting ATPase